MITRSFISTVPALILSPVDSAYVYKMIVTPEMAEQLLLMVKKALPQTGIASVVSQMILQEESRISFSSTNSVPANRVCTSSNV